MESSDPLRDYSDWHAALAIFHFRGVDDWQLISYSHDKTRVFDEVAELLHSCYEDCFVPYDEYLFENPQQIFAELYPDRVQPDDWSNRDLIPILKERQAQGRQEVEHGVGIMLTGWHLTVEFFSGNLAPENYGLVVLEGPIPGFVRDLLAFKTDELKRNRAYDAIAMQDLQLLGEMHLLAGCSQTAWSNPYWQTASAFDRMAAGFNEAYASKL